MGAVRGTDILGDFIDNREFYGNAFRVLSEATHFIMRHLPVASSFQSSQFTRNDEPALPVLAVREALINAICHSDYSIELRRSPYLYLVIGLNYGIMENFLLN